MVASEKKERFQNAIEPNVDDLDKAYELHQACCNAYTDFSEMRFETFIEIGESLRARQAQKNIQRF